jgi:hypothetical protein
VADEALTGFLPIYNSTVQEMRSEYAWFPMPTFEYRGWLVGLIVANVVFLLLTPFAFRNAPWLRPIAYFFAGVHLLNGTATRWQQSSARPFLRSTFRAPHPVFIPHRCSSRVLSIF